MDFKIELESVHSFMKECCVVVLACTQLYQTLMTVCGWWSVSRVEKMETISPLCNIHPPTTQPPKKMTMQLPNCLLLHLRLSFTKVFRR